MKKRIIYVAILSALICATILSGCNSNELTPKDTEPVTTTFAVETTVAPTTQVTETTVVPTTKSETTVAATEPQDTEVQTEAPKVEIEKPETNKPSSNTNNSGNSTTTQKPAQNINNNTSDNKKPSNNISQTVTDDTKLTHEQFCSADNMNRVSTALINRYVEKGMTYDNTITTSNSGWMYAYQGQVDGQAVRSYNEHLERIIVGMDEQLDAFMQMHGATYSVLSFNCYEELQADGEYDIYFCFK